MGTNTLKYNRPGSITRKAQVRLLEMLVETDRICKKHNITYWLESGSLLGAIRHKGFIPWDDDLDITLLRKDYIKLTKVLKQELPNWLILQNGETDKFYSLHMPYCRVVDKKSFGVYPKGKVPMRRKFKYQGLFIDLFYLERGNSSIRQWVNYFYRKSFKIVYGTRPTSNVFLKLAAYAIYPITKFIIFLLRTLSFIFPKDSLVYGYEIPFHREHQKPEVIPTRPVGFEGLHFPGPNKPDLYLRRCFKNYKELPREEARKSHFVKIDFY